MEVRCVRREWFCDIGTFQDELSVLLDLAHESCTRREIRVQSRAGSVTPPGCFTRGRHRCARVRGTNARGFGPRGPPKNNAYNAKVNVPNVYNLGSSASELRCLASRSLNPSTYHLPEYYLLSTAAPLPSTAVVAVIKLLLSVLLFFLYSFHRKLHKGRVCVCVCGENWGKATREVIAKYCRSRRRREFDDRRALFCFLIRDT